MFEDNTDISDLPAELMTEIFSYLTKGELAAPKQVCRLFYDHSKATERASLKNKHIINMAAGPDFILLLTNHGEVLVAGNNLWGQLSLGDQKEFPQLQGMPLPADKRAMAIAAGSHHSLILMTDGSVWGCGANSAGQLGQLFGCSRVASLQPINLAGQTAQAVYARNDLSLIVMTDGSLWACGSDSGINLNLASTDFTLLQQVNLDHLLVVQVNFSKYKLNVVTTGVGFGFWFDSNGRKHAEVASSKQVIAGFGRTIDLGADGSVFGFGIFHGTELKSTNSGHREFFSIDMQPAEKITYPKHFKVKKVVLGETFSIFMMEDYSLWSCGAWPENVLGLGAEISSALTPAAADAQYAFRLQPITKVPEVLQQLIAADEAKLDQSVEAMLSLPAKLCHPS